MDGAAVTLGTLIAWIESADNSHAMRFEPTIHAKIHESLFTDKIIANIRAQNKCTYETAASIYSTSFGLYQIMGNALFDPSFVNYKKDIFNFIFSIDDQNAAFNTFVEARHINFTPAQLQNVNNRDTFALHYNGSLNYAVNIQNALNHFGASA